MLKVEISKAQNYQSRNRKMDLEEGTIKGVNSFSSTGGHTAVSYYISLSDIV